MKILQPLAIGNVRTTTGYVLHMTSIDQANFESAFFQDLEQWNPVNPRGFHRDGADSARLEPVRESVQIRSERGETSDRLGIAIFGHGNIHFRRSHINAGSIGLHHTERGT